MGGGAWWAAVHGVAQSRTRLKRLSSSAHTSVPISQFIPRVSSVSTHPFPTSVSLLLPWKWVHLYHCSRFHIHSLINGICFPLSDFLHSVWHSLGQSTSLQMTWFLLNHFTLCFAGKWALWWWIQAIYKLWVLFFISARPTLPLAFSASPQTAVSHHSHPTVAEMSSDKIRQNQAVLCPCCHLSAGMKNWFSLRSLKGLILTLHFPCFPVTVSPSITSHWHCLSHEASNSFLLLHLFRNLWKHFLLPAPNTLHLCSIWVPKTNLKRSWWA